MKLDKLDMYVFLLGLWILGCTFPIRCEQSKISNQINALISRNARYHEHVRIQPSVVVDEPAMGDASEGFEGDGLVGIEPIYCWVTHYGPPKFHRGRTTARCITIRACLLLVDYYAVEWGIEINGFCAVHKALRPWWNRVRDPVPMLLYVEGHGNYLVLDRKGENDCVGVDIYEPDQEGFMYCDQNVRVWEVEI